MRFVLTLYEDETAYARMGAEEIQAVMDACQAFDEEVRSAGVWLAGEGLQPTPAAKVVQVRAGERIVTEGPVAAAKEQLGGFYLLECAGLDEALDWAAKIAGAEVGPVEVAEASS